MLQAAARTRAHAILQLISLRLQHRGPEQRDHFTLLESAEDLRVIEVTDADAHESRRIVIVLFHEHEHRAARTAGERPRAAPASASALSTESTRAARAAALAER